MILASSILFPLLSALFIVILRKAKRTLLLSFGGVLQALSTALLLSVAFFPENTLTLFRASDKTIFALRSDGTAKFFCAIIAIGWLLIMLYATVITKSEANEPRFYISMFLSEAAIVGAALASDLVTMYVFYELLTVCLLPLVFRAKGNTSRRVTVRHLSYSITGALLSLFGILTLASTTPTMTYTVGGVGLEASRTVLCALFCLVLGFGVKAGLYPLHGCFISVSAVSTAPVSALLSGLVTKAGILAVIRVLYFIASPSLLRGTWVQTTLLILSLTAILVGVFLAYSERILKKRLAYLTVSRVSYALVGILLFTAVGLRGAFLQIASHAAAGTALFLFAGAVSHVTGETEIRALYGIGKKLPVMTLFFAISTLSMIGIPPTGGFLSTWTISTAALAGLSSPLSYIIPVTLLLSALLTAGSLLPISVHAFYSGDRINPAFVEPNVKKEPFLLALPIILLAAFAVLFGLPAGWTSHLADLIVGTIL